MADEAAATAKDPSTSTPKITNAAPELSQNVSAPEEGEEDMLLVSEFPPPPAYYGLASRNTPAHLRLTPPEIPLRSFRVAAKKVLRERKRMREESERIRLAACADGSSTTDTTKIDDTKEEEDDDDSIDPDDPNEPVVAVFGEIVEDPTLTVEQQCDDPNVVRENVKRLNQEVLKGFLKLVRVLVNDPNENKKLRDELSHNLFLMIQECNKFREHQAREILINTLEQQLEQREEGLKLLKKEIGDAECALEKLKESLILGSDV